MKITIPTHLSDKDLIAGLTSAAERERETAARLVEALVEVDARRLYLKMGASSLLEYCVDVLGMSEDDANERVEAVKAARTPRV